jgi:PIN domain nuclease of toxin-antitoxin system
LRLILDTHALIWFLAGDPRLTSRARSEITAAGRDEGALISAVSAMEVVTKHRLGKLPEADEIAQDFETTIKQHGFGSMAISMRHAQLAGRLAIAHKDPFDRLLIAQSLLEDAPLVSNEKIFDEAGVTRIW